jgi:hypothetical protein
MHHGANDTRMLKTIASASMPDFRVHVEALNGTTRRDTP